MGGGGGRQMRVKVEKVVEEGGKDVGEGKGCRDRDIG